MPAGFIDYPRPAGEFSRDRAKIAGQTRENRWMARKKALSAAPVADLNVKPLAASLTPLELHAVAKAETQAKKLRDRLKVGNGQIVDVTVRVSGALNVAENGPSAVVDKQPSAEILLGLILSKLPPARREDALDICRAAYCLWFAGGDEPKLDEQQEAIASDFLRHLTKQVTCSRRGNVTGAIGFELISRRE